MKNILLLLIVGISVVLPFVKANGSRIVTIQDKEYKIDTLRHVKTGPGTTLTSLLYRATDGSKKFRGFYLTMEMKGHENVEYRMELGNDSTLTAELISSVAKRKSAPGNYYFAGVNADFYYTWAPYIGTPNMACYMDGQIAISLRDASTKCGHFFMDYNKNMWCDWIQESLSFQTPDNKTIWLSRINYDIFANELVLFNEKHGRYTKTADCTELAVKLVDSEKWSINKPCRVQVVGNAVIGGNMKIEANQAVLSAKGTRVADIENLKEGDILTMNLNTRLGNYDISPESIKECSGGDVVILNKGEVEYEANWWINGRDNNNPRTMFGYNEDRSTMVWGLIDGRSSISDGCTYPEGAEAMKLAGCYDAVNVDGGGSAEMYVQNLDIVNKPADGKERAVSNGLYAVLKAPEDNVISEIQFIDYAMAFPKNGIYKPVFYGYNKYGMLIDTDVKNVTLSCSESLGLIQDGNTFIGSGSGTYPLSASYNNITTSIPVTITENNDLSIKLESIINDSYRKYPVEVEAMMNETKMPIDPAALSWNSDDVSVVSIGADDGILQGNIDGTTYVHGTMGTFKGDLKVIVEKPTARSMAIDRNFDPTTWKISQTGGTNIKAVSMENGMKLTYTGNNVSRGANIKLAKKIQLWSLPDTIRLRINPGDAPIKKITISTNANGTGVVNTAFEALVANQMNVINLPTAQWCDSKDMINYPIYLNVIQFDMGISATGKEYTIEIPGIEIVYHNVKLSGVENVINDNNAITFYPNPVKMGEVVNIQLGSQSKADIYLYDEVGMLIKHVVAEGQNGKGMLSTEGLDVGVYLITIHQDNTSHNAKLIIQ